MGQHKGDIMSTETTTKSCRGIIGEELARVRARENDPASAHWAFLHSKAWAVPMHDQEGAIVRLVTALADYSDAHRERFESSMGDDGFLGPAWLDILKGTRTLLNGETGRLDCGTVDSMLVRMAQAAGYEEEEL
jgi:hypothetical protein